MVISAKAANHLGSGGADKSDDCPDDFLKLLKEATADTSLQNRLKVAMDIVEGVFAPIFGHKEAAEKLVDRVPPRAPRSPKK